MAIRNEHDTTCAMSYEFWLYCDQIDVGYFFFSSIEYAAISIFDFLGTIDALSVILSIWN